MTNTAFDTDFNLDNIYDFYEADLSLEFTLDLDIDEVPQTKPIQYPDFNFNFSYNPIDGVRRRMI